MKADEYIAAMRSVVQKFSDMRKEIERLTRENVELKGRLNNNFLYCTIKTRRVDDIMEPRNFMVHSPYALSMIDVERINKASKTIKDLSVVTRLTRKQRSMVKKVLFNNPSTIIWWKDGTKTVVKCQPGDTYDAEKGFMAAYLKKMLGNDNQYNVEIRQWVPQEPTE